MITHGGKSTSFSQNILQVEDYYFQNSSKENLQIVQKEEFPQWMRTSISESGLFLEGQFPEDLKDDIIIKF